MNVEVTSVLCYVIPALLFGALIVFLIVQLIRGAMEEPVIIRGKIVDMDVNAHSHTSKDSYSAYTDVNYKVRFISDEGTVYELSTTKSVFLRVRPGDYGDAHIKTIFRRLLEFEPVMKV